MGITITARGEIFRPEFGNVSRFGSIVGNVYDHEFLGHFRIEQRKNKMWASEACIHYCYIVGKCVLLNLLKHRGSKAIIEE